jgi:hypothetical protein
MNIDTVQMRRHQHIEGEIIHLESSIIVGRTVDRVWAFVMDPLSLTTWGRSMARFIVASPDLVGVGFTFDTLAPARRSDPHAAGARLSRRVTEFTPRAAL